MGKKPYRFPNLLSLTSYCDIPLPIDALSHLRLTEEQLSTLRKWRRMSVDELLHAEQKRLRDYVRQARHRQDPDTDIIKRGAIRTITRYQAQKESWESWIPPFGKLESSGGVSFDPQLLHNDAMEIRREYHHLTLLIEPRVINRPPLQVGKTLDSGIQDWLINLYWKLDKWKPRGSRGRKSTIGDSFFSLRPRREPLSLTVIVANHYLPDLQISCAMLDKVIRPRIDEKKTNRARRKERLRMAKERILGRPIDGRTIPRRRPKRS